MKYFPGNSFNVSDSDSTSKSSSKSKSSPSPPSVIELIQKMVEENQSESRIIATLRDLGVPEAQAKRLLLLGQAKTFSLVKSEISNMVESEVDEQKLELEKFVDARVSKIVADKEKDLQKTLEVQFVHYRTKVKAEQEDFQKHIKETIAKMSEISEDLKEQQNNNAKIILDLKKDLDEARIKGLKTRKSAIRLTLNGFGVLCFISAIGLFIYSIFFGFMFDYLFGSVIFVIVGVILMYSSLGF